MDVQMVGEAKDEADAFALKQRQQKARLATAAAAAASAAAQCVDAREKMKRGRGGRVVDMGVAVEVDGAFVSVLVDDISFDNLSMFPEHFVISSSSSSSS